MSNELPKLYKVVILGSFKKHYEQIKETIDCFIANGFEVLSPQKSNIINPNDEFVLFDTDISHDPKILEEIVLKKMREANIIYICNVNGYIGRSVGFELGNSINMRDKVYFLEKWNESFLDEFFDESKVIDPLSLCNNIMNADVVTKIK